MPIYNVKKFHLQANLFDVFAENKKQHYYGGLVLVYDWQFCKSLQPLVNRI